MTAQPNQLHTYHAAVHEGETQPLLTDHGINVSTSSDHSQNPNLNPSCFNRPIRILLCSFTDWPMEVVKHIMPDKINESESEPLDDSPGCNCSCSVVKKCLLSTTCIMIRLIFIIYALFAQYMFCFRRDWITANHIMVHKSQNSVKCQHKRIEFIRFFLIPDIIIVLLATWVYIGLKFGSQSCSCECCGWKEINDVMLADKAENLTKLAQDTQDKLKKSKITVTYTIIPLIYIILSLVISFIYLAEELRSASKHLNIFHKDLIIIPPINSIDISTSILKILTITGITLSFIGFIFLDLLYLQVMLRYAYRCQLIIYYLETIEEYIINGKQQDFTIMNETENAYTFIKELNTSSFTVAILIITAGFQAVNCAVNLLSEDIIGVQVAAVIIRLLLWGFLIMFPFHKAAGINVVYNQLQHLGWHMKRKSFLYEGGSGPIILKAKMLGIPIKPWFPHLLIFALLFTIMAGLKLEWLLEIIK